MTWLPKWLSFLSGLPETKRKRRIIVPVQAYADESGMNDGTSTVLVIAALISDAQDWAILADEWDWCLKRTPAIQYLKMREAAKRTGQFRRWSEKEVNDKLIALAAIINRCKPLIATTGMHLGAYSRSVEMTSEPLWSDPYFLPFHTIIWDVTKFLWDFGLREKFEFIFDEQVIFGLRAKEWYPAFRHIAKLENSNAFTIMPVEPVFRSDTDALPLQAADMFAWVYRYSAENPGKPNPYEWLFEHLKDTRRVKDVSNFGPESPEQIMADSEAMKARAWTQEEMKAQSGFTEASKHIRKRTPKKKRK
jgi:hypothetical protein